MQPFWGANLLFSQLFVPCCVSSVHVFPQPSAQNHWNWNYFFSIGVVLSLGHFLITREKISSAPGRYAVPSSQRKPTEDEPFPLPCSAGPVLGLVAGSFWWSLLPLMAPDLSPAHSKGCLRDGDPACWGCSDPLGCWVWRRSAQLQSQLLCPDAALGPSGPSRSLCSVSLSSVTSGSGACPEGLGAARGGSSPEPAERSAAPVVAPVIPVKLAVSSVSDWIHSAAPVRDGCSRQPDLRCKGCCRRCQQPELPLLHQRAPLQLLPPLPARARCLRCITERIETNWSVMSCSLAGRASLGTFVTSGDAGTVCAYPSIASAPGALCSGLVSGLCQR